MTQYQGFRTKKEAETFRKNAGEKGKRMTIWRKGEDWHTTCCILGGLDGEAYPWVVKWSI